MQENGGDHALIFQDPTDIEINVGKKGSDRVTGSDPFILVGKL